ncbi:tryptophan synthase subunit alpha [Rhodocytophaga aerolata]|uniref:Tryptophan synthase alpha chain n=1 Tax=Rhodocytophaga aerolata TaxID=455078 RepID=A0ABT8RJC6_9BACT|nr:tryptophan synthase subunit alpha [Rhodocytophaga aerolata]MDO1451901.1 tryptophan synthase subunit alpha [Rhodocytophaga aerolata]
MNRITALFTQSNSPILNIYYTAGYPALSDTLPILTYLEKSGVDMVEIGMPYSDPVADGPTIQQSNDIALSNGMSVKLLFEQLQEMRKKVGLPVLLMGYLNPVLQYGIEAFCRKCKEIGVDGVILPDMPMSVYLDEYKAIFDSYGLLNIFLITPQTSIERIRQIDQVSDGFIYMVSSASVTGATSGIREATENYFKRIKEMKLKTPTMIGFGISDKKSFDTASSYANGAIIGSAFVKALQQSSDLEKDIASFVSSIKG